MTSQRCVVTGAPIVAHQGCLLRIKDNLPGSPPRQLHTRLVEGQLGGHAFSRQALSAMHDKRDPAPILSEAAREWFNLQWLEPLLYRDFAKFRRMLDIVYLVLRDRVYVSVALNGTSITHNEYLQWVSVIQRVARKYVEDYSRKHAA